MNRRWIAVMVPVTLCAMGCWQQEPPPRPERVHRQTPPPSRPQLVIPLTVPEPGAPKSLEHHTPATLAREAVEAQKVSDWSRVRDLRLREVEIVDRGRLDLARAEWHLGAVELAVHHIQEAARREGFDTEKFLADPDFQFIRSRPDWEKFLTFLGECQHYWNETGKESLYRIFAPRPGERGEVRVVVHFRDDSESIETFLTECDLFAREHQVACIALLGARREGKMLYSWTGDPETDLSAAMSAVVKAKRQLHVTSRMMATGKQHGATLAGIALLREPVLFESAILLVPNSPPEECDVTEFAHPRTLVVIDSPAESWKQLATNGVIAVSRTLKSGETYDKFWREEWLPIR